MIPNISFSTFPKKPGPQISRSITEQIEYFILFFTDELINGIIKDTNAYAVEKIYDKQLSKQSICNTWENVTKEFLAFIAVILNMGMMPLSHKQAYWATSEVSYHIYENTFTRDRFKTIFWMQHLKQTTSYDKSLKTCLQKSSSFLEYINDKFSDYLISNQCVVVAHSIITAWETR